MSRRRIWFPVGALGSLGGAGFLLVLVLLSAMAGCQDRVLDRPQPAPTAVTSQVSSVQRPIGHYTPGAVSPGIGLADLCPHLSAAWEAARHSLSPAERRQVKGLYGIPAATPVAEWDHLIPRELGGADTAANIWPMTIHAQDQRKDRLENALHRQVCANRLELAEAQERAREFWLWWGP